MWVGFVWRMGAKGWGWRRVGGRGWSGERVGGMGGGGWFWGMRG